MGWAELLLEVRVGPKRQSKFEAIRCKTVAESEEVEDRGLNEDSAVKRLKTKG